METGGGERFQKAQSLRLVPGERTLSARDAAALRLERAVRERYTRMRGTNGKVLAVVRDVARGKVRPMHKPAEHALQFRRAGVAYDEVRGLVRDLGEYVDLIYGRTGTAA
jgi:hypothetical protein